MTIVHVLYNQGGDKGKEQADDDDLDAGIVARRHRANWSDEDE